MIMKNKLLALVLASLFALDSSAQSTADSLQGPWTLSQCIDYALEQNITIQQNKVQVQSAETDVKTAKAALFPSLSANTSHRFVNRPGSEVTSYTDDSGTVISSDSKNSYNGSYGIDASWTVWNGGKNRKSLEQQKLVAQQAELSVTEAQNTIEENITQIYVQILYALESINVNEQTVEVSQAELDRARELFQAGSLAKTDVAQLQTTLSSAKYQLVTAQSTLADYKLQLKQMLELEGTGDIEVYVPQLSDDQVLAILPTVDDVYRAALETRPEIQNSKLSIESADLELSMARAGYYPTLSVNAGISTSHTSGSDDSFGEQVKTNWSNSIGISLNIPIISNRQNKSAVEKARYQQQTSQLSLTADQKTLYKTIESLYLDAINAQQNYIAAQDKLASAEESYELVSEQFAQGMKNTVELLSEKSNYISAQQELLQSKYMAILEAQLLHYYAGEKINIE